MSSLSNQKPPPDLARQLDQALSEVYSLHELAKLLVSSIELESVVAYILDGLCGLLGTESSFLYSHEPESGILRLVSTHGPMSDLPESLPHTATHWIAQAAQLEGPYTLTIGDQALAVMALRSHDTLQGLVGIATRAPRQFTPAELDRLAASAHLAAMALENARLHARLQALVVTDGLTGLCNHRHFYDALHREMARARRQHGHLSLIMLDIDHFKEFNDTFGHVQGDQVLRTVANILRKTARDTDVVARYGGEEFAVILPDTRPAQARRVAERFRQQIARTPFGETWITVSIGVAHLDATRESPESPPDLVRRADQALYRAKQAGRNRVCMDDDQPGEESTPSPGSR